jgi:hypothetical protein
VEVICQIDAHDHSDGQIDFIDRIGPDLQIKLITLQNTQIIAIRQHVMEPF